MNKLFNYAGTKINFCSLINQKIESTSKNIYVEPFLGSGAIFLNLDKKFDKYILNDLDRNVIRIFKSFKYGNYQQLINCAETIADTFGDIKSNKESYYNFRNAFNTTHWKKDTIKEGFYLYILYNSCLNSMARFGPNGFNQSFGLRQKVLSEHEFISINVLLQKAELYCVDFFELIKILNKEEQNCFMFLDPPYIEREVSYSTIDQNFFNRFIDFLKNTKCQYIYTDIDHNFLEQKIVIREQMNNISPNRKQQKTFSEVMFFNY